jgi:alkylation response protein AidB-like acyl-CoA dehydrogenase
MNGDASLIRTSVARFARREVAPRQAALEHGEALPAARELLGELARLGLLALDVADPGDRLALLAALRTLAAESPSIAALLLAHAAGRALAAAAGAPQDDEARWGYPLYADLAATSPAVIGVAGPDGVVLIGGLELCAGAPLATHLLVPAEIDDDLELVAVPTDGAGVTIDPPLRTLGLRGLPTADVRLRGARLAPGARLARGARARDLVRIAERRLRGPALGVCAGIAERSLRETVAYATQRYQGGVPIAEHQEVRRLLAGLVADHARVRLAAEQLAAEPGPPEPVAAALFADSKERVAHATCDGVQLLGGYGYLEDYQPERLMRDAKQAQVLLGRCEVARQALIEAWLADGAPRLDGDP